MAFIRDTLHNTINENSSSPTATATATTTIKSLQMNSQDLNLKEIWNKTATTTVKFLLKRNANANSPSSSSDGDNDGNDLLTNDNLTKNVYETTTTTTNTEPLANNLTATITSIRSNVSKVLYRYFHTNTTDSNTETTILGIYTPLTEGYSVNGNGDNDHEEGEKQKTLRNLLQLSYEGNRTLANVTTSLATRIAAATTTTTATVTSDIVQNSTYNNYNNNNTNNNIYKTPIEYNNTNSSSNNNSNSKMLLKTLTHLTEFLNTTATTTTTTNGTLIANTTSTAVTTTNIPSTATITTNITYPSINVHSYDNCSALFANYSQSQSQKGLLCNWVWDKFLCWPPTPAGVLARMSCPSGHHGVDAKKFAHRKCELNGHWASKANDTFNPIGWTDYNPCFKQEVKSLMEKVSNLELVVEIAKRTRTLEIVGLILSLVALIISLIIFCNFRSLRNNRTKIHKNLFMAMVLQVVIRLTLYLDQAYRRDNQETTSNNSLSGIENTPYLCEASYVLLEYAKTAMFMWMFIEGWYLHNMVTVTVFQGRFPYKLFFLIGWGMPVLMTVIWATCTAIYYAASNHDCWWNYNLTPYYWILEGPRIVVITINFGFLLNIISVLVMKLRESQASDIEQTRKAVRAAIVLLPLLGTINVLYLIPALETPWKFALWSYVTHFLTTFQGFFIALLYCFLNGEVRAVLLKSLAVFMSLRGHPEWVPKRASMYSAAYNTAPDTENQPTDNRRNESPSSKRLNGRKASCSTVIHQSANKSTPKIQISPRLSHSNASVQPNHHGQRLGSIQSNNNNGGNSLTNLNVIGRSAQQQQPHRYRRRHNWMLSLCFRGQKNKCVMPNTEKPSKVFMTTKMETYT